MRAASRSRHRRSGAAGLARAVLAVLIGVAISCGGPAVAAVDAFDVAEFRVRGNTVLDARDIEKALMPLLGTGRTIDDVERARTALEQAYQARGFLTALVDIPPQKVAEGVVILRVTEGSVRRVRISGSRYYSLGEIRAAMPSIAEGTVPDFNALQRELAALNNTPDRTVTPILKPAPTPGAVDVELKVQDQLPLHGSLEVHNRHTLNTNPLRVAGQLRYDNLWQLQHSLGVYYELAPERAGDADVRSISYVVPTREGIRYAFYALRSRSDIAAVGGLDVIGQGSVIGARAILPIGPGGAVTRQLTIGLDHKDFDRQLSLQGLPAERTPLKYTPVFADLSTDRFGPRANTGVDAGFSFLPRSLASDPAQFAAARAQADTGYLILRGGLRRTQSLLDRWSLAFRMEGQLASAPLVGNEQFAAGGVASVRGYRELEALGDDGVRASLEFRSEPFGTPENGARRLCFVAFVDGAYLHVREPLPQQQARFNLLGTGVGLRWRHDGLVLDVDAAVALLDALQVPSSGSTVAGNTRLHFRMAYAF